MKKLLGSVRRALSKKTGANLSPSSNNGNLFQLAPLGARGATVNRLPGTAIVPQPQSRDNGMRTPLRIDILGAGIAQDFKKAVREDEEADAKRRTRESHPSIGIASGNEAVYPSVPAETAINSDKLDAKSRATSGLTNGSKSIVIVDDTLPPQLPLMAGALPINPSTDTFADAFLQPSTGPTPPSTPPGLVIMPTPITVLGLSPHRGRLLSSLISIVLRKLKPLPAIVLLGAQECTHMGDRLDPTDPLPFGDMHHIRAALLVMRLNEALMLRHFLVMRTVYQ
jgi:hypothetical protein